MLGLASGAGLVWCALIPWIGTLLPEDDYNCGAAPRDLVVIARLVGQEQHTVVENGLREVVRVDRYAVEKVERGRWSEPQIELEAYGFASPIRRHRLFIDLDPESGRDIIRDRVGAGLTSHKRCGGNGELGFVWPANFGIFVRTTPWCTWVVLASAATWIWIGISALRRRTPRRATTQVAEPPP